MKGPMRDACQRAMGVEAGYFVKWSCFYDLTSRVDHQLSDQKSDRAGLSNFQRVVISSLNKSIIISKTVYK